MVIVVCGQLDEIMFTPGVSHGQSAECGTAFGIEATENPQKHQRIDNPAKAGYIQEKVASYSKFDVSRDPREGKTSMAKKNLRG